MPSATEREWKFDAEGTTALPGLDPAALAHAREVALHAVYWDTPDHRLLARGVTLRYRTSSGDPTEGWTLKLPVSRSGDAVERLEVKSTGGPDAVPEPLRDLVGATVRRAALGPIATIDTERRVVDVLGAGAVPAAELADDRVVGTKADGTVVRFRQIEVEVIGDDPTTAAHVAALLALDGLAPSAAPSKLERVVGAPPPPVTAVVAPGPDATLEAFVRAGLAATLAVVVDRDPVIRTSDDVEAVHVARVAARRLRSDLRTLRPVLHDDVVDPLRIELRWLGTVLGGARDLDVLADGISRMLPTAGVDPSAPVATRLLERLTATRGERRAELQVALRGPRYAELLDRLETAAVRPPMAEAARERPAAAVVVPLARAAWRRVGAPLRAARAEPPDEALHEVRKRVKRARYAAEAAAAVVPDATGEFAREMKRYQDVLGEFQDAVTAQQWLEQVVTDADPEVAFLAGTLWARAEDRRVRCRTDFLRMWDPRRATRFGDWFD